MHDIHFECHAGAVTDTAPGPDVPSDLAAPRTAPPGPHIAPAVPHTAPPAPDIDPAVPHTAPPAPGPEARTQSQVLHSSVRSQ